MERSGRTESLNKSGRCPPKPPRQQSLKCPWPRLWNADIPVLPLSISHLGFFFFYLNAEADVWVTGFPKDSFFLSSLPGTRVWRARPVAVHLLDSRSWQVSLLTIFWIWYNKGILFPLPIWHNIIQGVGDQSSPERLCGNSWNLRICLSLKVQTLAACCCKMNLVSLEAGLPLGFEPRDCLALVSSTSYSLVLCGTYSNSYEVIIKFISS